MEEMDYQEDDDVSSTMAVQGSENGASSDHFDEDIEYVSRTTGRNMIPRYRYDRMRYMVMEPRASTEPPGQAPQQQFQAAIPSGEDSIKLSHLPGEIQETILDSLLGSLGSISCSKNDGTHGTKNWSSIMRHPRRRQVSDLALISPTWRRLVQQRIYRHGKCSGCPDPRAI